MNPIECDRDHTALLLIDLQPDFCPGGALPVDGGDQILPGVSKLMHSDLFAIQAATQDWHPRNHISFADNHEGKSPLETIQCHGHEQVLWPPHCVEGTPGARLHPELPWDTVDAAEAGFATYFIWDLTRAVNPQDDEKTRSTLDDHDVKIINTEQLCR